MNEWPDSILIDSIAGCTQVQLIGIRDQKVFQLFFRERFEGFANITESHFGLHRDLFDDFAVTRIGVFVALTAEHHLVTNSSMIIAQDDVARTKQTGPRNHFD